MTAIIMEADKLTIQYSSSKGNLLLSQSNMLQNQNYQQTLQN